MDSKVLVYHERQVSLLCGVHAINSLLQGGFFTEIELGSLAQRLDEEEATLMRNMCVSEEDVESMSTRGSLNVSNDGDFSLQVLARALNSWGLKCDRVKMEDIMALLQDTETEKAFICHLRNHWFCIRRVDGQWYNLNSLNKHPIRVSDFYLDAYLGSLDEQGYYLFAVTGQFPSNEPMRGTPTSFGKWWTAEEIDEAERLSRHPTNNTARHRDIPDEEDEQLQAAIQESIAESAQTAKEEEDNDLAAAIALSMRNDPNN